MTRDSILEMALVYLRVVTVSSVMCLGDNIFSLPKLNFISGQLKIPEVQITAEPDTIVIINQFEGDVGLLISS